MNYELIRNKLEKAGVKFDPGLTNNEFALIEKEYGFRFPPDLREFLSKGLPISINGETKNWVNWRRDKKEANLDKLNWPYEGICFDVENNNFWMDSWGKRPESLKDCFNKVKELINKAPKLIPIFSHRYIPDRPYENNNPIISVWQTDMIYYGSNLQNYFDHEFYDHFRNLEDSIKEPIKNIEFWTDMIIDFENKHSET